MNGPSRKAGVEPITLANMNPPMRLGEILTQAQNDSLQSAPQFAGNRHPTWFPLFYEKPRRVDTLVNVGVSRIASEVAGMVWLDGLVSRLVDLVDVSGASAALAELRAYSGLLTAGFKVTPVPCTSTSTPDFEIDAGDGKVIVEVFAKHQDKEEDALLEDLHSMKDNPEIHGTTRKTKRGTISQAIVELTPGGKPDPEKPCDSVQANVISRICSSKQDEAQFSSGEPSILILDLSHFGGPIIAEFLNSQETTPLMSGQCGFTSGPVWYAFYGWKGAPIFQESARKITSMGHDGRYRHTGKKQTKLSAVLVVLAEYSVLLENPWTMNRLPTLARKAFCRYPDFDFSRSIADWHTGDLDLEIQIQRRKIEEILKHFPTGSYETWSP